MRSLLIADVADYTNSIVPQTDDPNLPQFTARVAVLGLFWCITLGVANTILSFRTVSFVIGSTIATLLTYPMGIFLAGVLPKGSLNPGPFNVKEHVLVSIIASGGVAGAYGIDNVVTQKFRLYIGNDNIGFGESFAWVLSTQFIGFGIGLPFLT